MARGKIKWFSDAKGFGFILSEDGGKDLFVHYSAIQMDGFKTLTEGDDVSYDLSTDPKGKPQAVNVVKNFPR